MKSETIEVIFRYRIRYDTKLARQEAIREAKNGRGDLVSVGTCGSFDVVRKTPGKLVRKAT